MILIRIIGDPAHFILCPSTFTLIASCLVFVWGIAEFNYLNKDSPLLDPRGQIPFIFMALLPKIDKENILESLQTWGPLYIWVGMVTAVIPPFLMPSMFKDWVEQKAKERQEKKRNQEEKEKKRNQEEKEMEKIQSDAEASTAGEPRG
jgi:hypothetical protein